MRNFKNLSGHIMKNVIVFTFIVSLICIFMVSIGASATEQSGKSEAAVFKWRLAHQDKIGSERDMAAKKIAEEISKGSKGRINITVYPAGQLGDWVTVYGDVMRGSVQMCLQQVPASFDPRLAINWFPYAIHDYKSAGIAFSKGGYIYDIVDSIINGQGVKLISSWGLGMGGAGFSKPVPNPTDPNTKKGMKIRVWPGGTTHKFLMERLGFMVSTLPWAEVYTALQTGVVDGHIGSVPNGTFQNFKGVTKMYIQYNDHFESNYFLMNMKAWDSLSSEDKALILDVCSREGERRIKEVEVSDRKYIEGIRGWGAEVVEFDSATQEKFATVCRNEVWPQISNIVGDVVMNKLKAGVGMK